MTESTEVEKCRPRKTHDEEEQHRRLDNDRGVGLKKI